MKFQRLKLSGILGGLVVMGLLSSARVLASPEREDHPKFERRLSPDTREQIRRRFSDADGRERRQEEGDERQSRQLSPEQRALLREQIKKQSDQAHQDNRSKIRQGKKR